VITDEEYGDFVASRIKNPKDIEFTIDQKNLLHMTLGICGEAGELLDTVKKHCIYGKELDYVNLEEELGDIEFYLEGFRQQIKLSRQTILDSNHSKLSERYKKSYTDAEAIERLDKVDG